MMEMEYYPYRFSTLDLFDRVKSLREKVNWQVVKERREFIRQLYPLTRGDYDFQSPINLREIFRKEEIDWLLSEAVKSLELHEGEAIIEFVSCSGYKDEPDVDEDGKPLLRRTTAIHHATRRWISDWSLKVGRLFEVYDRFDANYVDESGLSHFHVACKFRRVDVVQKFLELGHDPNCLWTETGDAPLHMTMSSPFDCKKSTIRALLSKGAEPNLANKEGSTPLHVICKRDVNEIPSDEAVVRFFSQIGREIGRPVRVDARDKLGRTPLQWAVARCKPSVIDALLNHGAKMSNFVFPTEDYFGEGFELENDNWGDYTLILASRVLTVIERLEKRGYELDRAGALTIMKFFAKHNLFQKSAVLDQSSRRVRRWLDNQKFAIESKRVTVKPSLSFYELMQLRAEEVEKVFAFSDCYKFAKMKKLNELPPGTSWICLVHLIELMSRKFCRRWALDPLLELTSYQLPILCCEKIIEKLKNESLFTICLAAADRA
uniref:Uncharacterized protein n=1 Tax=Trichogramma kaykai TaxID=54128 RepID=A0ABD2XI42_9HYME